MKRRVLVFLLCMLLTLPVTAAAVTYTEGYFYYEIDGGSVTITGYFGHEKEVTVPNNIAGLPVSTIASGAFNESGSIKQVNLPDTIMSVEGEAFGSGQTVVYNSNTDDQITWQPQQETQKPTNTPGVTQKPNATQSQNPTQKPNTTQSPQPTQTPNVTQKPGATQTPNVTQKPGATQTPNVTQKPGATQTPNVTQNPNAAQQPGASQTQSPAQLPGAEQSAAGVQTTAPSMDPAGGLTAEPEQTAQNTPAPDAGSVQETEASQPREETTAQEPEQEVSSIEVVELTEDGENVTLISPTSVPRPTAEAEQTAQMDAEWIPVIEDAPRNGTIFWVVGGIVLILGIAAICMLVLRARRRKL